MLKKKKIPESKFISKLSIRNYPSKTELLEIIDKYISSKELKKDYEEEEKSNLMILTFKDTTVANVVLEYLQLKISENQKNYEKMKVHLKTEISNVPEYKIKKVKALYREIPKKYINLNKKINLGIRKKVHKSKIEESPSPYLLGEPFIEQNKIKQKEELKKKKLWISKKVFNNFASNNNSLLKESPVYTGPGINCGNYRYREVHKELWTDGNFIS
jgi:hypothetical protein